MTDMHCHILPCVDDGAGSVEEACSMAWKAWENGTKRIIATPHYCRPDQRRRRSVQEYRRYVYLLQQGLRELGCGLELRAGMEVFATAELPKLLDRQEVLTLQILGICWSNFILTSGGTIWMTPCVWWRTGDMSRWWPIRSGIMRYKGIRLWLPAGSAGGAFFS